MDGDEQRARFLSLLQPIEGSLESYSRRMVFDRRDCEDALQNAVLRALRAFDRYHDDAGFRAWMFKILTNEIFAINRKRGRIAEFEIAVGLSAGAEKARTLLAAGLIDGAALHLQGETRVIALKRFGASVSTGASARVIESLIHA